jgi:hypothetical protein
MGTELGWSIALAARRRGSTAADAQVGREFVHRGRSHQSVNESERKRNRHVTRGI